ncbi:MAG: hypothetical protein QM754_15925 [Tepidisphaeraceae bacterium]
MTFRSAAKPCRRLAVLIAACGVVVGCAAKPKEEPAAAPPPPPKTIADQFKPYIPSTQPVEPVAEALPTAPKDARARVPLRYSVELWEILLPRDTVSVDESFWKRVDEPVNPEAQRMQRNGIRVGELPMSDLETVRKLIDDRGGKHTTYNGINGKLVEIPIRQDVSDQMVFFIDHDGNLRGRTWERCDNFLYFSFETTPRNPDRVRISLTPGVRSRERRMTYATVPGKPDREVAFVTEQSEYDVTVSSDLMLDKLLIIAPSTAARQSTSIGGTFLMDASKSKLQERLILVIPHAFTSPDTPQQQDTAE